MTLVTVRGSLTPCIDLPRGVERTVQLTDTVRRRVRAGYYELVEGSLAEDADPASELVEHDEDTGRYDDDSTINSELTVAGDEPPAGNASTEEWRAFLLRQGIDIPVDEDGDTPGREGLKMLWQQVTGGS